ncbi:MAG TPA: NADH:ubiquinone reductase (Na(+)-transporting) subunit C [Bacteroidales bacterium]|nr:NADH:ubiquinone reductase (Na(+)-transporting) subunit C [Bacteroidales bacterium]
MNIQSNKYTYMYSTIIVLIVATGLAIVATALKPDQDKNIEIEKKQNILTSLRVTSDPANAEVLYDKYITDSYTLNSNGEKVSGIDPFTINLRNELKKTASERNLPAFEAKMGDSTFIVIPVYGKGLWGPIWGYVSFRKEENVPEGQPHFNTIYGVMFDHKGETPGLGAEINQPFFMNPFQGKKIFNDQGEFVSVDVVKGGADPSSPYQVDAISGGTITSKGLQAMLDSSLVTYQKFFKSNN